MSYLDSITNQPANEGQRIVLYGPEGIGKTTLACDAPGSLLIPLEAGYSGIQTPRVTAQLTNWAQIIALCEELRLAAMQGKITKGSTIVWDTATALERIIHAETIRIDEKNLALVKASKPVPPECSMETAHGGYGKAYPVANAMFERWANYQDELAKHGKINIVVTCHAFVARIVDPASGEYDSFDLLLHSPKNNKNYGKREFLMQWADMVCFLHSPIFVMKAEEGQKLARAIDANQGRKLAVDRSPGWAAKNRYGLTELITIPKEHGWNYLADAVFKSKGIDLYNRQEN